MQSGHSSSPGGPPLPTGASTPVSGTGGMQQSTSANNENSNAPTQVSSLPLPPTQYIKIFTDENVSRGIVPGPPPPLLNEGYTMFGTSFPPMNAGGSEDGNIIQSLESQGIRRLYSSKDVDRKKELRKLNHSILVNFLDLLDVLIACPDSPKREEKIEDLNLLFIHMHHFINEFRPHQARETLRVMLHVQKRKRLQVADKFQNHLDKVQESIQEALESMAGLSSEESISKLMISKDNVEHMDTGPGSGPENDASGDSAENLDLIMCQIADEISLE